MMSIDKEYVYQIISSPFSTTDFLILCDNLLPDFVGDERDISLSHKSLITSAKFLGTSEACNISVMAVKCEAESAGVTKNTFKMLSNHGIRNALIALNYGGKKWRISLLTSALELVNGKIVTKNDNPRRYSYLFGDGVKIGAAKKYLIKEDAVNDLKELMERFSYGENGMYYKYWEKVLIGLSGKSKAYMNVSSSTSACLFAPTGVKGIRFQCYLVKGKANIALLINTYDKSYNKSIYDAFYVNKTQIEKEFGDDITWERKNSKKMSAITVYLNDVGITDDTAWDEAISFMVDKMPPFEKAIMKVLKSMDKMDSTLTNSSYTSFDLDKQAIQDE